MLVIVPLLELVLRETAHYGASNCADKTVVGFRSHETTGKSTGERAAEASVTFLSTAGCAALIVLSTFVVSKNSNHVKHLLKNSERTVDHTVVADHTAAAVLVDSFDSEDIGRIAGLADAVAGTAAGSLADIAAEVARTVPVGCTLVADRSLVAGLGSSRAEGSLDCVVEDSLAAGCNRPGCIDRMGQTW